jgi:hypothetical protein
MMVPVLLQEEMTHKICWRVSNFKKKPVGVVTDVSPNSLNIVFSFCHPDDGKDLKGNDLSFQDICDLFKKFEPRLIDLIDGS